MGAGLTTQVGAGLTLGFFEQPAGSGFFQHAVRGNENKMSYCLSHL
jgi:hypothetical protein